MDITIKGIEGLTEQEVKEWIAILIERKETAKVNQIQAVKDATTAARTTIDNFRKANLLTPKFEAVDEIKEM